MPERIRLKNVSLLTPTRRVLFAELDLSIGDERVALVGRNGVGKSTLLALLAGEAEPASGSVHARSQPYFVPQTVQDAASASSLGELRRQALERARTAASEILLLDEPSEHLDEAGVTWLRDWLRGSAKCVVVYWLLEESLLDCLLGFGISSEASAQLLLAHRFPLALSERSLRSLSAGERARAALICLYARSPSVEVLVLDEPTFSLDLVGLRALTRALKLWPGGLVIASHDRAFLAEVGVHHSIRLGER